MAIRSSTIAPCLWFDTEAEDAAKFYTAIFKGSRIGATSRYGEEGFEIHGKPAGTVLAVEFEVGGLKFVALNGGPQFKFNEAISFQVPCETQAEIDYFWDRFTAEGEEGHCGWLKDKFGVSWQIIPAQLASMMSGPDAQKSQRVMKAFLQMKKFDIAALERAYAGQDA